MVTLSERVVNRYLRHATEDMLRNNHKVIRCPCRKCRLEGALDLFSGQLLEHLLRRDFMEGHTQWISDDEDDDQIHGAAAGNDQEGQQVNDDNEVQEEIGRASCRERVYVLV